MYLLISLAIANGSTFGLVPRYRLALLPRFRVQEQWARLPHELLQCVMWKNPSIPSVSLSGDIITCHIDKYFAAFETAVRVGLKNHQGLLTGELKSRIARR